MAEPYDPIRDLAIVLHGGLRQGFWQPAARGAITRLRHELGLAEGALASDIERALRDQAASRRAGALADVAYLASLSPQQLREAVLVFRYEQPDKAARLLELLTGQAQPRHLEQARASRAHLTRVRRTSILASK